MAIMREHKHRLEILECARGAGDSDASLLDTKGPEIRTGKLKRWKESDAERGRSVYADDRGDRG